MVGAETAPRTVAPICYALALSSRVRAATKARPDWAATAPRQVGSSRDEGAVRRVSSDAPSYGNASPAIADGALDTVWRRADTRHETRDIPVLQLLPAASVESAAGARVAAAGALHHASTLLARGTEVESLAGGGNDRRIVGQR